MILITIKIEDISVEAEVYDTPTGEAILAALKTRIELEAGSTDIELLEPAKSCRLSLAGKMIGYLGELTPEAMRLFELRRPARRISATVAGRRSSNSLIASGVSSPR